MERFGEKLSMLRRRRGVSMRELTQRLGYSSHSYISRIEAGKKKPSIGFIIKVADLFDVSVDQLVRDELELHQLTPGHNPSNSLQAGIQPLKEV